MALLVAVIVVGVVRMVPGSAPLLAEGAELARPSDLLFYALAALAIASACGVAFSRNIIYSALSLLGALIGAGALYVYLKADYVAVTQLLVYIGGVLVLILFAVMLTGRIGDRSRSNPSAAVLPGVGLLAAVLGVLGFVAFKAPWQTGSKVAPDASTASRIGDLFLGEYLLAFEVVSLLLLATLIGAVVIARKEIKE
ncbi:MAG: NADH-quinone oxidoreductase subunit J [Myxococcales bacterium]|nr:NADH-quinone oxidoreductase subunit J [Myxococcales bacterium]